MSFFPTIIQIIHKIADPKQTPCSSRLSESDSQRKDTERLQTCKSEPNLSSKQPSCTTKESFVNRSDLESGPAALPEITRKPESNNYTPAKARPEYRVVPKATPPVETDSCMRKIEREPRQAQKSTWMPAKVCKY